MLYVAVCDSNGVQFIMFGPNLRDVSDDAIDDALRDAKRDDPNEWNWSDVRKILEARGYRTADCGERIFAEE